MLPTEEQTRLKAYRRWELRGKAHGFDQEDWYGAEQDLLIWLNYDVLVRRFLDEPKKAYIGAREPRVCRYCGKDKTSTSFKMKAHALPESVGNTSLIANDECDSCNVFFSETIEDSFGKLFLPLRNVLAISGKTGVPSYLSEDKGFRIDFDSQRGHRMKDTLENPRIVDDVANRKLRSSLHIQPFVPIRVFKCFAKMAIAILPESELANFRWTMDWIREPDDRKHLSAVQGAGCFQYYLYDEFPHPWVALLRRKTSGTPLPYMMIMLGTASAVFHSWVPLSLMDGLFAGRPMVMPKMGSTIVNGDKVAQCQAIRMASADVVRGMTLEVEQTYAGRTERDKE